MSSQSSTAGKVTKPQEIVDRISIALLATQRASWEQGTTAQTFLELCTSKSGQFTGYSETIVYALVNDALVRQNPVDGRWCHQLNTGDPGATDPACIGEAVLFTAATIFRDTAEQIRLEESARLMIKFLLELAPRVEIPSSVQSDIQLPKPISHRVDKAQLWSDAPYMMPPFLVAAGLHFEGQSNLINEGLEQILVYSSILQHPEKKLWSHIYDGASSSFERALFWGVGNGWVCAGVIRCMRLLFEAPLQTQRDAARSWLNASTSNANLVHRVLEVMETTLIGCLRYIRKEDSLFHDIVDDDTSFVETNLAQMLAYSIYRYVALMTYCTDFTTALKPSRSTTWGMPAEWTKEKLLLAAEAMYAGSRNKLDEWGFVRGVCGSPRFDKPGTAAEGQAFGILMEVARQDYLKLLAVNP